MSRPPEDPAAGDYWSYSGRDVPTHSSYTVQTTQRVEFYPKSGTSTTPVREAGRQQFTEVHHYTTVSTSYGAYPPPPLPTDFSAPPPSYLPPLNVPPPPILPIAPAIPKDGKGVLELEGYKVSAKRADKIMELLLNKDTTSSLRSPPRGHVSYNKSRSSQARRPRSRSPASKRERRRSPRRNRSPPRRRSRSPRKRSPRDRRGSPSLSRSRDVRSLSRSEKRPLPSRPKEKPVGRVPPRPAASQSKPETSKSNEDLPKEPGEEKNDESCAKEMAKYSYVSSAPFELYYKYNRGVFQPTQRQLDICKQFEKELLCRGQQARASKPTYPPLDRKQKLHIHKCCQEDDCDSSDSDDGSSEDEGECSLRELEHKKKHPDRLHPELWFNDPGEMNDGPLCRCSMKSRKSGIRHGIYAGEEPLASCNPDSNNAERLYHYRITISPPTNFLTKLPTVISHDGHEYLFEGFSLLSHYPLGNLPVCKVIRFNFEYTIVYIDEDLPYNFTMRELDLFYQYLFVEILELVDFNLKAANDPDGCPRFHFFPRFVRELPENGISILCMSEVLKYLLEQNKPLVQEEDLLEYLNKSQTEWLNIADEVKGMIVLNPGMKPSSVRVDQLDREKIKKDFLTYPEIVHFGIRPPQLSYAGNAEYNREWREYVKLRHLIANSPKPSSEEKYNLKVKEDKLQEMRMLNKMKRDVTVAISSEGFNRTGIMADIVQHAMVLPVLVCHLRFHKSVDQLEKIINYQFQNRYLLQLALTHPSYRENFGTNPDHARNSLTNCGIRQPEYGDRRIHYQNTRKRGIKTLISIMSLPGKKSETESNITHNERLEFLGDAVVEFVSSIHLFFMFPDLEEGGLATYRAAIVQNQHLALLAKTLHLEEFMLYAHGSDLCHDLELRHAMANCFEALMGALYLDGGIDVADRVFSETFFKGDGVLASVWINYPLHPLQQEEPSGDRHWVAKHPTLQKLVKFEEEHLGIPFNHIRLLARAFTDRSIGYNNITLGSNQRLEFLGDTVLQLIASNYLYKHFPNHHEGHLSLLRSSLVNNRTQARVCDDIGLTDFAIYSNPKSELKTKDRADLLEALLGSLYVDKDLDYCTTFCNVCFFPRLRQFILNQDWNDPKSKLQQCCLTLRTMDGKEPDIPYYKVVQCIGPTNTRVYTVAVYFRNERLATAVGHSIQQAEMNAAKEALMKYKSIFPQINHQKMVLQRTITKRKPRQYRAKEIEQEQAEKSGNEGETSAANKKRQQKKKKASKEKVEEEKPVPCPTLSSLLQFRSTPEEKVLPRNTDLDFSLSSSDNDDEDIFQQAPEQSAADLSEGECSSSD
ncbi:ribonuclease 3 isoform X2 [Neocloeon triangulifer]|uniref:ribonuclease 3 isoform X2 n=1 Tax=Neocloeon triangulifer TaxID=2078957 RepID=UPI00286F2ABE|nr:ribonuclease 3 isoform X2 [Neocloeon triangulifer]